MKYSRVLSGYINGFDALGGVIFTAVMRMCVVVRIEVGSTGKYAAEKEKVSHGEPGIQESGNGGNSAWQEVHVGQKKQRVRTRQFDMPHGKASF